MLVKHFSSTASVYAYLVFILLYIPCISTMAVIKQEANRWLMWGSMIWSLLVAYVVATLCYQCATFLHHPQKTLLWIFSVLLSLGLIGLYPFFKTKWLYRGGDLHATSDL